MEYETNCYLLDMGCDDDVDLFDAVMLQELFGQQTGSYPAGNCMKSFEMSSLPRRAVFVGVTVLFERQPHILPLYNLRLRFNFHARPRYDTFVSG